MKKLLILTLLLGSIAIAAPAAEAKTVSAIAESSMKEQPRRWNQRRSVIRTRVVRIGFRTYRETYRITYGRNGRGRVQVISRVRIR